MGQQVDWSLGTRQPGAVPVLPAGVDPSIVVAFQAALSTGVAQAMSDGLSQGVAALLSRYEPLLDSLWVAFGPARQTPTQIADPLPIATSGTPAQQAAGADPLRQSAVIQNIGNFDIVVGKDVNVGQPSSPDKGIRVAPGQNLALSGGEWTQDIYWATISSAGGDSSALVHEAVVPPQPWKS